MSSIGAQELNVFHSRGYQPSPWQTKERYSESWGFGSSLSHGLSSHCLAGTGDKMDGVSIWNQ